MTKDGPDNARSPMSPLIKAAANARSDKASADRTTAPSPQASASASKSAWPEGSWRGKANAVAGVARQTVSLRSSTDQSPATGSRMPNQPISQGMNTPSKSTPSVPSTTPLHATSGFGKASSSSPVAEKPAKTDPDQIKDLHPVAEAKDGSKDAPADDEERPAPVSGWRGWWTRGRQDTVDEKPSGDDQMATETPRAAALAALEGRQEAPAEAAEPEAEQGDSTRPATRSSWFGLLGSAAPAASEEASTKGDLPEPASSTDHATNVSFSQSKLPDRPASGTWAFWMRDSRPKSEAGKTSPDRRDQVGELAVSGTDSQSKPQIASVANGGPTSGQSGSPSGSPTKKRELQSSEAQQPRAKRKSIASILSRESETAKSDSDTETPSTMQESVLKTTMETPPPKPQPSASKPQSLKLPDENNLVLPLFDSVYPPSRPPSYFSKLAWMIGRGHSNHAKHLTVSSAPHRVKRGLAIGVHGLFPSPMLQKILGPPKGTSIRFADGAADAIREATKARGYSCEIEKVALEGEGIISDRIDTLWSLLLNWIDQIRKADFIFVACHSQGVPVAVSLVARLLNFGCVPNSARIGICGMAGVNLGPFATYQSRFLQGSAAELFSLSQGTSPASQAYASALTLVLKNHVRIMYVGSIDDQLVSLESSTFSNVSHPYIYRAVYVDGRVHAPDFLTRLVGFSLKLRNLGISDHGLVRELSGPLAGSLYTGEGHSRIYEEQAVYELAVRHALDTDTLEGAANPRLDIKPYEVSSSTTANPYFLPWAMRGMLEEEYVRNELKGETEELLGLFDMWRPQSKVLKDVKFRLEAVKSKL